MVICSWFENGITFGLGLERDVIQEVLTAQCPIPPPSQSQSLSHEIPHLRNPLAGSLVFFILVLNGVECLNNSVYLGLAEWIA